MKISDIDKFFIAAGRISLDNDSEKIIRNSVHNISDWKRILEQAGLHRIDPFIYYHLKQLNLLSKIPKLAVKQLEESYRNNKKRNILYLRELDKILTKFRENNIKPVLLKGAYLVKTVYQDIGLREFSDIDILVKRKVLKKSSQIMENLGYRAGEYNWKKHKIETFDQITNLLKQRYSGHIRFLKETKCNYCPVLAFEIHFDLFFKGEEREYRVNMNNFWKDVKRNGSKFYSLSVINNLIYLCFHIYHDAFGPGKQLSKTAVRLLRFCDLREFIMAFKKKINWDNLMKLAVQYGLELPFHFSLSALNDIYGQIAPGIVLKNIKHKRYIKEKKSSHDKNIKKLLKTIHQIAIKQNEN